VIALHTAVENYIGKFALVYLRCKISDSGLIFDRDIKQNDSCYCYLACYLASRCAKKTLLTCGFESKQVVALALCSILVLLEIDLHNPILLHPTQKGFSHQSKGSLVIILTLIQFLTLKLSLSLTNLSTGHRLFRPVNYHSSCSSNFDKNECTFDLLVYCLCNYVPHLVCLILCHDLGLGLGVGGTSMTAVMV